MRARTANLLMGQLDSLRQSLNANGFQVLDSMFTLKAKVTTWVARETRQITMRKRSGLANLSSRMTKLVKRPLSSILNAGCFNG